MAKKRAKKSSNSSRKSSQDVFKKHPNLKMLLLLLLLSVLVFSFLKNNYSQTSTTTPSTIDQTANWKTYTNTKSDYLFKYPADWTVTAMNYLNSVQITNKSQTVSITISEGQYPYGFGGDSKFETKNININVGGKEYLAKETITDNSKAYIDLELDSIKKHHILFGTGSPAGSDDKASIEDYNNLKETILTILSTFKFTE